MDYVPGKKITDVSPIRRVEIDGMKLSEDLWRAYLKQILVDGFFHADPHPGNVFLTQDDRIALIDLGMVSHVSVGMREQLLRMFLAIADGRGEEVAEITIRLGEVRENFEKVNSSVGFLTWSRATRTRRSIKSTPAESSWRFCVSAPIPGSASHRNSR